MSPPQADDVPWIESTLTDFVRTSLPAATGVTITGLHRIGGGASRETWSFDAGWTTYGRETNRRLILRRDPPAGLLASDRRQECAVLEALRLTNLPVPRVRWLDLEGRWLARPSIVMDWYAGVADRKALTEENHLGLNLEQRIRLARELCCFLARLHIVELDTSALDTPAAVTPAHSVLDEWELRMQQVALEPQPDLYFVLGWLRAHVPSCNPSVLVHGDFRPGNVLVQDGRLRVVLDWETAHLGDPLEDLGWHFAPYYRREHFIPGHWEPVDFLAEYAGITGVKVDTEALEFWVVLALFKICVIALGGIEAFCSGSSERVMSPAPRLFRQLVRQVERLEAGQL